MCYRKSKSKRACRCGKGDPGLFGQSAVERGEDYESGISVNRDGYEIPENKHGKGHTLLTHELEGAARHNVRPAGFLQESAYYAAHHDHDTYGTDSVPEAVVHRLDDLVEGDA